jgi:NAD(P)-dependent dehydrogenase (short-subunit alcohol dehydrogenase family)
MKSVKGKVAAVTGAASGIGRATAELLARRGCHVAISDVNEQGLAEAAARCRAHGVKVRATRLDVAQREAVHAWADEVAFDNRRLLAVQNAKVPKVPVIVVDLDAIRPGTTITWRESLRRRLNSKPKGSSLPKIKLPDNGTPNKPIVCSKS